MDNKLVKQLVGQVITKQDIKMLEKFEALEAQVKIRKKEIEAQLLDVFKENGIKTYDTPTLRITYVEPATQNRLDTKALKEQCPDVYQTFLRETLINDYIKIKVKYE